MKCTRSATMALLAGAITTSVSVATADTFGPDAFGYEADDSAAYAFEDISLTGTPVIGCGAPPDDTVPMISLGFMFDFYGSTYFEAYINENGFISFQDPVALATPTDTSFNVDMTTAATPSDAPTIAVLWDDWDSFSFCTSSVLVETRGTATNRRFIVQWNAVSDQFAFGDQTFQVILFEGTNKILMQYSDVISGAAFFDNGAGATVGIRNSGATGTGQVCQVSVDAAAIFDGDAISFEATGPPPAPDPADEINELVADVEFINLHKGIANSLDSKLDSALNALSDSNTNNDGAAVGALGAFINHVEAQRGNKIDEADADFLIAQAQAIIDLINGT